MSGVENETDDFKVTKADIELARKLVAQFQDDDFDCERISFELACHRRAALSPSAPEAPSEQGKLIAELAAMTRNRDNLRTYLAERTRERNDARDDRDMWRKYAQEVGAKAEAMVKAAMGPDAITRARQPGAAS